MTILNQPYPQTTKLVYAGFFERALARIIDSVVVMLPSIFLPLIAPWLYFALMESGAKGATVGKRVLGLRVLSEDARPIEFGTATGRFFGHFISLLPMGLGYLVMLFNSRRQCFHDMIAGTVVVRASSFVPMSTAKPQDRDYVKRSWSAQVGEDAYFVEINPEGGLYRRRNAQGETSKAFTLWQLTDGVIDLKGEFGPEKAEEMRQFAEELLRRKV